MTTFKDAIKKKNIDYNTGYRCECCNMRGHGKPWAIYKDVIKKNICSYLCYGKMNMTDKNLWSKVINKNDFFDLRPILPDKKNDFMILTNEELMKLDDKSLKKYYERLNVYYYMNPERAKMQLKIMENSVSEFDDIQSDDSDNDEQV